MHNKYGEGSYSGIIAVPTKTKQKMKSSIPTIIILLILAILLGFCLDVIYEYIINLKTL